MSRRSVGRQTWRGLLFVAAMAVLPASLIGQTGRIVGTVTDTQMSPIYGAMVSLPGTRIGTLTNANGQFVLANVPAGEHQLQVTHTGYGMYSGRVMVSAGSPANVQIRLEGQAIQIGGVVVSASRQAQRITDAPATVTRIEADAIDAYPGSTWAGLLKEVKGLDFIQVGMASVALNARGFNSSFNNRMLMMEDGRIAVLPENGLPVGQFTAVPKVDLAGVEVLIGPGAALYGADASNGVVTLQSRDPRQFPGTTVEMTAGNNAYKNVQARQAGVVGDWGYKVAGEWLQTRDWENYLSYTMTGVPGRGTVVLREDELGPNSIDWNAGVKRGTGSVVRYFEGGQADFSAGISESDGVGQTNVGRNQLRGWGYNFAQARLSTGGWYLNAYRAQSTSGESFALNRYADAFARNPNLSADSLRKLSDWPSNGQLYAAEIQNNFRLPALLNTGFVWGAQYRRDVVSSDRQWLTDRLTGRDITIGQAGVYAQTETPVMPWLNVVLAGRYDDHQNYDAQFSPKAALVFKPTDDQALRVSFNRAFKSPTTLQTSFHIPDWTATVAIFGNTEGFTVKRADGTVFREFEPLRAEQNTTWEIGYKGVLANRIFVDVAGYHSTYENFMSPLAIISDPFGLGLAGAPAGVQTRAYDAAGNLLTHASGSTPLVLTYYNLGQAKLYGTDAGINYYLSPNVRLKSTLSLLKVDEIEVEAGREEATAINAPNTKWTLGADFSELGAGLIGAGSFQGAATLRHVSSYYFRSGINRGVIPTFSTLDIGMGYNLPRYNTTFNVAVANLFTCSQDDGKPFIYAASDPLSTQPQNKERKCGAGVRHQEMINMPAIGTMLMVGFRYHGLWGSN
jgi:outer membrane receptor for ferrienterochelin and colicins